MSPRSRSRSYTSRRTYSRSAERRNNGRRRQRYGTRSRSRSRHAPITPPSPNYHRHTGKYSCDSRSCSRSWTPRYERHYYGGRRHGSRSRSRSYSPKHSPIHNRNTREKPLPSRCIGVFGLSVHTTQQKIREIFSKYGPIDRIQVVIDAQTGRSRGFCFIYYQTLPDAKAARDNCCGMEIDGRRIRVAYSITERPHTPTPGIYMGRSTKPIRDRYRVRSRRHSPSPYSSRNGRRRHERSRSPSITPPRYSRY